MMVVLNTTWWCLLLLSFSSVLSSAEKSEGQRWGKVKEAALLNDIVEVDKEIMLTVQLLDVYKKKLDGLRKY